MMMTRTRKPDYPQPGTREYDRLIGYRDGYAVAHTATRKRRNDDGPLFPVAEPADRDAYRVAFRTGYSDGTSSNEPDGMPGDCFPDDGYRNGYRDGYGKTNPSGSCGTAEYADGYRDGIADRERKPETNGR